MTVLLRYDTRLNKRGNRNEKYSVSVLIGTTRIVEVEAESEEAAMEAAELELVDDYDNEFMIEAQEAEEVKQ